MGNRVSEKSWPIGARSMAYTLWYGGGANATHQLWLRPLAVTPEHPLPADGRAIRSASGTSAANVPLAATAAAIGTDDGSSFGVEKW